MRRAVLWVSSLGVAAASCLAVLSLLRDPPGAQAPAPFATAAEPASRAARTPAPAPPPPGAPSDAQRLEDAARAAQAEEQALRDAILGVAADESLPLGARLERYRDAARAAQARAPGAPLAHPGMLAEAFLRAEPVQRELTAMSPSERARELAHVRRTLGFGEDEIARMEQIDAWREARWQNGLAYMAERERVTSTFEGGALDEELRALRTEYFGLEAPTIEAEEQGGFYRFERPRVYGRN